MAKRNEAAVAEKSAQVASPHAPVALVMPHNNARNQIIAPLLTKPSTVYYALSPEDQDYLTLSQHIVEAFAAQGFKAAAIDAKASSRTAGRSIGASLGNGKVQALVLDQFDIIDQADPADWIAGVLETLPSSTQLVLNPRYLNTTHWNALLANGVVSAVGPSRSGEFPSPNGVAGQLEVFSLGNGAVWYEGRLVTKWDGPLTRRLFYYLLDRGPVSRRPIFDTFWPNLPTREATNVFHVTKRKMNETIGCDATDYSERHYRIGDQVPLFYDVTVFEQTLAATETADEEQAMAGWERAVWLYRQPFLSSDTTPWIVARRAELREKYVNALVSLARNYQGRNSDDLALMHYLRAIREAPMREDLYAHAMTIYADMGDKQTAVSLYETLRTRLAEQLQIAPGRETTRLFTKLSR